MAEYINREAVLTEIYQYTRHYWPTVSYVESIIKEQPAADVEPVQHGRWEVVDWVEPDGHGFGLIKTNNAGKRCSNCRNCFKAELLWKDNFCPNCGAKMDGGVGNG